MIPIKNVKCVAFYLNVLQDINTTEFNLEKWQIGKIRKETLSNNLLNNTEKIIYLLKEATLYMNLVINFPATSYIIRLNKMQYSLIQERKKYQKSMLKLFSNERLNSSTI